MPHTAIIQIDFQSYWLAGTGAGLGRTADVKAYRVEGWPAIPMTQVKGSLRETADHLASCGVLYKSHVAQFEKIFGDDDIEAGAGFDGDALVPHRLRKGIIPETLFTRVPSTQISASGVAVDRSLRAIEVVRPVRLEGIIDWPEEEDFFGVLDLICKATLVVGKLKTNGYGSAILSCQRAEDMSRGEQGGTDAEPQRVQGTAKDQWRQRLHVFLTARQNMQFGRQPGTDGIQRTLSHPSGASLLGWCAQEYSQFDDKTKVFHSGAVQFGPVLPAITGAEVIPVPKTFSAPKDSGAMPFNEHGEMNRKLVRHGRPDTEENTKGKVTQFQPLKKELMTADLRLVQTKLGARVRTAIDDRRAAENKLFTTEHVEAIDKTFHSTIEFNEGVTSGDKTRIADLLSRSGIRLGRDKRTGGGGLFDGAVLWEDSEINETDTTIKHQQVSVLCLSDLAATDRFGLPALLPAAETLGLGHATLLRDRSVISHRRYAPWNGLFRCPVEERMVIEAGSVLTYRLKDGEDIRVETRQTIGQHQETGLGRIWIAPWFLETHEIADPPIANFIDAPKIPQRKHWAPVSTNGDSDWLLAMARYSGVDQ